MYVLYASGSRLASRLFGAISFGPIYLWYALARGVMSISDAIQGADMDSSDDATGGAGKTGEQVHAAVELPLRSGRRKI